MSYFTKFMENQFRTSLITSEQEITDKADIFLGPYTKYSYSFLK